MSHIVSITVRKSIFYIFCLVEFCVFVIFQQYIDTAILSSAHTCTSRRIFVWKDRVKVARGKFFNSLSAKRFLFSSYLFLCCSSLLKYNLYFLFNSPFQRLSTPVLYGFLIPTDTVECLYITIYCWLYSVSGIFGRFIVFGSSSHIILS